MPGPTPVYVITFNGSQLPGYAQTEEQPFSKRIQHQPVLNRSGSINSMHGADERPVALNFLVKSRLASTDTDLNHLHDCEDQWRDALGIVGRVNTEAQLLIGNTDRYLMAMFESSSQPKEASKSRSVTYTINFIAQPYYRDITDLSDTFTGNGTASVFVPPGADTYPRFVIPNGVTAFTATHDGRTITFDRLTFSGNISIDCSNFKVFQGSTNASRTMQTMNYGLTFAGTGSGTTRSVTITGFAGSGTVTMTATPRYFV